MPRPQQNAALATAVGAVAILVVMLLHPTGADAVADQDGSRHVLALARGVHGLAIAAIPLLLAGMSALSWRLRARPELAVGGLVCFLLASVAVMAAAAMSGFVAPALLERLPEAGTPLREVAMQQLHYTGALNQAFAKIYVGLTAVALLLWSLAMRGNAAFPRALAWFGPVAGVLPLAGVAAGHLRLDVRGFGLVVLLHAAWMLWAAWVMRTADDALTPP